MSKIHQLLRRKTQYTYAEFSELLKKYEVFATPEQLEELFPEAKNAPNIVYYLKKRYNVKALYAKDQNKYLLYTSETDISDNVNVTVSEDGKSIEFKQSAEMVIDTVEEEEKDKCCDDKASTFIIIITIVATIAIWAALVRTYQM